MSLTQESTARKMPEPTSHQHVDGVNFFFFLIFRGKRGFPCSSVGKESTGNAGDPGSIPGSGRSPGEGNGNHSSILAWKIPWTEEPGGYGP